MMTDWQRWASLSYQLPSLAEAAPDEFLSAVETALEDHVEPFAEMMRQENSEGFMGGNYMSGLLWALEGLAWSPDYLSRATVVLGGLHSRHPGGQSGNRPMGSLVEIHIPWLNNTSATTEQRNAAIEALRTEYSDTAWELLQQLLPNHSSTSTGTHKPTWLPLDISEDWTSATNSEYIERLRYNCTTYVSMADETPSRLVDLASNMADLPKPAFEDAISVIESHRAKGLPDDLQFEIWEKLGHVTGKHRRFSDAKWAIPSAEVDNLEALAERLQPDDRKLLHAPLFSNNVHDLFGDIENWEEHEAVIKSERERSIEEILEESGFDGVFEFANTVDLPHAAGWFLGQIIGDREPAGKIRELVPSKNNNVQLCLAGYSLARYLEAGPSWLDSLDISAWPPKHIARLLSHVEFNKATWVKVKELLGKREHLYWKIVENRPLKEKDDPYYAVSKLTRYKRPLAAISVLFDIFHEQKALRPKPAVKALIQAADSKETPWSLHTHYITEIIKYLQRHPDVALNDICQVEWIYLKLLGRGRDASPVFLQKQLAGDPKFYLSVIQTIYRSKKTEIVEEVSEADKAKAGNAYELLMNWKRPPGLKDDGDFDKEAFKTWLEEVVRLSTESGHLEVALIQAGEVLFYTPPDASGLWINRAVAEKLNQKDLAGLRRGYRTEAFNSRGVHSVDPQAKPELDLARAYRQKSADVELLGLAQFSTVLRQIAEDYERQAQEIIASHQEED